MVRLTGCIALLSPGPVRSFLGDRSSMNTPGYATSPPPSRKVTSKAVPLAGTLPATANHSLLHSGTSISSGVRRMTDAFGQTR